MSAPDNSDKLGFDERGADGRPVSPPRYRPRAPFLAVDSEQAYMHGSENRVEKPRERGNCAPARRRRQIQVTTVGKGNE